MSRFTPGPWAVIKSIDSKTVFPEDSRNTRPIARAVQQGPEQNEANAQAIAALPELVDYGHHLAMLVLQSELYQNSDVKEVVDNLLATLNKLEGKEYGDSHPRIL